MHDDLKVLKQNKKQTNRIFWVSNILPPFLILNLTMKFLSLVVPILINPLTLHHCPSFHTNEFHSSSYSFLIWTFLLSRTQTKKSKTQRNVRLWLQSYSTELYKATLKPLVLLLRCFCKILQCYIVNVRRRKILGKNSIQHWTPTYVS